MEEKDKPVVAIASYFTDMADPRVERTRRHKLIDILVIGICTVICGGDDYTAMEDFGKAKEGWLRNYLELPNGIPSHDTFWRVFSALDPEQFQQCFLAWMAAISTLSEGEIVALDGKQLRRSHDRSNGKEAIYMVSAWAAENELVLGQRKVDEKSNEITAIPELLMLLHLSGCIVTIDAIGTQTNIAKTIVEGQGDYVLSVKENQGHLYEDISVLFAVDQAHDFKYASLDYHKTVSKGHGRIEVRECWSTSNPEYLNLIRGAPNWVGLRSIAMVISTRIIDEKETKAVRFYISSLESDAKRFLHIVRKHWSIENELHWVLDVALNEDHSRVRKDQAPKTWLSCATLRLTCSNKRKPPRVVFVPNSCKPLGIRITFSKSLLRAIKMRLP